MSGEKSIKQFFEYFGEQLLSILNLRGEIEIVLYKKILYSAILDSLAKVRFPGMNKNRERFIEILREYSSWQTGALVSVPILKERIIKEGLKDKVLLDHCNCILGKFSAKEGNSLPITAFDAASASVECVASEPSAKKLINETTHFELFYKYRNFIVHEFREPGYAMEVFAEGDEPIYHGYLNEDAWRLLYPEGFFRVLVENTISSLEEYFLQKKIDPYERVKDSSAWLSER